MDNKVIDIKAADISASRPEAQVTANVSVTEVTTNTKYTSANAILNTPNISTRVLEPVAIAAVTNTQVTPSNSPEVQVNVTLTGYGEAVQSNYGNLFVRPSEYLNNLTAQETAELHYYKSVLLNVNSTETSSMLIAPAYVNFANTTDFVQLLAQYLPSYYDSLTATEQLSHKVAKNFFDTKLVEDYNQKLLDLAKLENLVVSEYYTKTYNKSVLETVVTTDDFQGLANLDDDQYAFLIKVALDTVVFEDLQVFDVRAVYEDNYTATEATYKLLSKIALPDLATASDQAITVTHFRPNYYDSIATTDDFLGIANLDDDQYAAILKVAIEEVYATEILVVDSVKVLYSELLLSEQLANALSKKFNELVSTTDDFQGLANLDDDQVALVVKRVVEQVSTSEWNQYVADFNRYIVNVALVPDVIAFNLLVNAADDSLDNVVDEVGLHTGKIIEEDLYFAERYTREKFSLGGAYANDSDPYFDLQFNLLDSSSLGTSLFKVNTSKVLATKYSVYDVPNLLSYKVLSEELSLADYDTKLIIKGAEDTVSTALDLSYWSANAGVVDLASLVEVMVFDTEKSIHDTLSTTDDFYGLANLDDDQIAAVIKVVKDTSSISDYVTFLFTPVTPLYDTFSVDELHVVTFDKILNTSLNNILEEHYSEVFKVSYDELALSEVNSKVIDKLLHDYQDYFPSTYATGDYLLGGATTLDELSVNLESVFDKDKLGLVDNGTVFDAYKKLFDTASEIYEIISFDLAYNLSDAFAAQDVVYNAPTKGIENTLDGTYDLSYWSANAGLLDLASLIDVIVFDSEKSFHDYVGTSDDFYGLANLDDDQLAAVVKVIRDTCSTSDYVTFLFTPVTPLYDTFNVQEIHSAVFSKVLSTKTNDTIDEYSAHTFKVTSDSFGHSDVDSKVIGKGIHDYHDYFPNTYATGDYLLGGATTLDELFVELEAVFDKDKLGLVDQGAVVDAHKKLFDANSQVYEVISFDSEYVLSSNLSSVIDLPVYSVIKAPEDTAGNFTEVNIAVVNKVLLDIGILKETLIFNNEKTLEDNIAALDDFYGLANLDDDQVASVSKVLKETTTTSEYLTFLLTQGRWLVDTALITEILSTYAYKVLLDTAISTETISFQGQVVYSDETDGAADIKDVHLYKVLSGPDYFLQTYTHPGYTEGGVLLSDSSYLIAQKSVLETSTIEDTAYLFTNKDAQEITNLKDKFTITLLNTVSEINEVNIDETHSYFVSKTFNDFVGTTETLKLQTNDTITTKVKSFLQKVEAVTLQEVKTANISNYNQAHYLFSDYIGTNYPI